MNNLIGKRFGRLTVIKQQGKNKWRNYMWLCKCDCGNEHLVAGGKLIQGKVTSCGCYAKELHIKQLEKHGITTDGKPRTFIIWNGMKARCLNPKSTSYKNYGARGIKICDEWLSFENFHNWAISNGYGDDLQIDRKDNNGNYEPSNCRWVTKTKNMQNQRRKHYITIKSRTETISEWIKILKLSKSKVYRWLKSGDEFLISKLDKLYLP